MKPLNFVAVILKVFLLICLPLWTLPTFFKNKKRLEKNVKNAKNVFYIYGVDCSVNSLVEMHALGTGVQFMCCEETFKGQLDHRAG